MSFNYLIFMQYLYCRWAITFIFAALFGIPAFIIHLRMGDFDIEPVAPGLSMANLILLILSTIVQVNTTHTRVTVCMLCVFTVGVCGLSVLRVIVCSPPSQDRQHGCLDHPGNHYSILVLCKYFITTYHFYNNPV